MSLTHVVNPRVHAYDSLKVCVVAMHGMRMPVKYQGVIPTLSLLLGLLQKRTPWSVGMYLKKGGISRYLKKLHRN